MGDPGGIGPEVIVKAYPDLNEISRPIVIGSAIAFWLVGPAIASAPAFMTTIAVVLPMLVIGQRVAAKEFDIAFWMAVGLVVLVVGSTIWTPLT